MKITQEYLDSLETQEERDAAIFAEYLKCRMDPKYCIETYYTVDAGKGDRIPFILYPHQVDALYAYEHYVNNITMKTRQMGFTVFTAAYICWKISTNNNFKCRIISKTQKDSIKFIMDIKNIMTEVQKKFPWLCPQFKKGFNNKQSFTLLNGSEVVAESTTEDAGRGTTLQLLVVDEAAFIDRKKPQMLAEIWSAAGVALTKGKGKAIIISTPKGMQGWYYDTYNNAKKKGFNIIDAHWIRHPEYNLGSYQYIQDTEHPHGGYIKFLNGTWPKEIYDKEENKYIPLKKETYGFICDGRVRSPWYDFESAKLGPERTRCELDCSFMGTGGEVFDPDTLRALQLFAQNSPYADYKLTFESVNGLFKHYKEYIPPIVGHRYVLGADVATGDGSDYSAFAIIDVDTFDVVATFKAQLLPNVYAIIIGLAGKRYFNCPVVVENAGGGGTTLQDLKANGYPNIYYSVLKKNDPSTGMKKRKLGLWPSEQVRWEGGDRLEEVIRNRRLKIHCTDFTAELFTWIWDKDGKRRHAPERNDDLIMGCQHAVYYIFYVIKRGDRNRAVYKNVFEVRRNGQSVALPKNEYTGAGGVVNITLGVNPLGRPASIGNVDKESGAKLNQRRRGFFL